MPRYVIRKDRLDEPPAEVEFWLESTRHGSVTLRARNRPDGFKYNVLAITNEGFLYKCKGLDALAVKKDTLHRIRDA